MFRNLVMALLYVTGTRDAGEPKQMYFPPRPVLESCLNVNLSPWFENQGINHAIATMMANTKTPETVVRSTARNLVLTQPGMVEDPVDCAARIQTLFEAMAGCQIDKRTQRALKRKFRGVN